MTRSMKSANGLARSRWSYTRARSISGPLTVHFDIGRGDRIARDRLGGSGAGPLNESEELG